jgi:O-antigen/teichoic acid export membrane protein
MMRSPLGRRLPSAPLSQLVLSRLVDQGVLAAGSLALARLEGPEAFAPIALLLVINSLAIQVSDFGLGFAVLRARAGQLLASASLRRLRFLSCVVLGLGTLVGLTLGGVPGATIVSGSWVWALSAEAYVRKSAALRGHRHREVAVAEITGAVLLASVVGLIWALDLSIGWFGLGLVAKHAIEIVAIRDWEGIFSRGGAPPRSGAEWLGQVSSYAVANVDYLIVGLVLAPSELSTYLIAFRVASAFPALLANPITNTAFVELAEASPADRVMIRRGILRRAFLLGLTGAGMVMLLAPLVPQILGSAWSGTGWLVAILAPAVPFRLLLGTAVASAITIGAANRLVVWELGRFIALGATAFLGATFGLVAATAAVSIMTVLSITAVHLLTGRLGQERTRGKEIFGAGLACLVVVALACLGSGAVS